MNESDLILRLDNLLRLCADLAQRAQTASEAYSAIDGRLRRIERAHAIPMRYSRPESCQVLGISVRHAQNHPELLPSPVSRDPLRYLVSEVEERARGRNQGERTRKRASA